MVAEKVLSASNGDILANGAATVASHQPAENYGKSFSLIQTTLCADFWVFLGEICIPLEEGIFQT